MGKENNNPPVSTSKYSLVRAIVTLFKLGDEGKVENFFVRQRRALERDVATAQKEMDFNKFNHEQDIEDLDDKIVDAEQAVSDAYLQIDASKIGSNSEADDFASSYWKNILRKEGHLESLKEERQAMMDDYSEKLEDNKKDIAESKRRLGRISAEKDA